MNEYIIPGLSLGVTVSIIFAIHGIVQQQIKNLQDRLEQEATRLKENTEKSERRLDDLNRLSEQRLKDETSKAEQRLKDETRLHFASLRLDFEKLEKFVDRKLP